VIGFFSSPQVAFGPGAFEQVAALGIERALLVLDPQVAAKGLSRRLEEEIEKAGGSVERVTLAPGEASFASIPSPGERAEQLSPDWVVALGGGSTIDAARALWVEYENPDLSLETLSPLSEHRVRRHARFLAVPTTNGSGADSGWSLHLRDAEGRVHELSSRQLVADWVLLEPGLTDSLDGVTYAEEGVEALAHALEALASEWANAYSDALARAAVGLLIGHLPSAVQHRDDAGSAGAVQLAGSLAGHAVANAQIGLGHALAHAVGPLLGVSHRAAVVALLPAALEFSYPATRERYEVLGSILGAAALQSRAALGQRVRAFLESVGLPANRGFGVPPDRLESVLALAVERAQRSMGFVGNPRVPSASEISGILRAVQEGRTVDF
jgi:alcohol dehydrogenase